MAKYVKKPIPVTERTYKVSQNEIDYKVLSNVIMADRDYEEYHAEVIGLQKECPVCNGNSRLCMCPEFLNSVEEGNCKGNLYRKEPRTNKEKIAYCTPPKFLNQKKSSEPAAPEEILEETIEETIEEIAEEIES
jgi:hypothetical protein